MLHHLITFLERDGIAPAGDFLASAAGAPRRRGRRRPRQGARVPAVLDRREERLDQGRARFNTSPPRWPDIVDAARSDDRPAPATQSRVRLRGGLTDMALSNRDRIGRMFRAARTALDDFIASVGRPARSRAGCGVDEARRRPRTEERGASDKTYDPLDPQVQLRMLTEQHPARPQAGLVSRSTTRSGRAGRGVRKRAARGPQRLGAQQSPSPTTTPTVPRHGASGC